MVTIPEEIVRELGWTNGDDVLVVFDGKNRYVKVGKPEVFNIRVYDPEKGEINHPRVLHTPEPNGIEKIIKDSES